MQASLHTYQLAVALIDTIRKDYFAEESKYSLAEEALPIYEQAIETAITAKEFELAFEFAEKGKAIILLEATHDRKAKISLPDSLTTKEYALKKDIAFYKKQIFDEKQKAKQDSTRMQDYETRLFEKQRQHEDLKRYLKANFTNYYRSKYDIKTVSVKEIQQNLLQQNIFQQLTQESKALIEYFVGDSIIYTFTITDKDIFVDKTKKTSDFEQQIYDFRKILSQENQKTTSQNYATFHQLAFQLYQNLLEKPLQHLPETQNLILIPDAALLYIPLGILTKEMPKPIYIENKEYDFDLFVNSRYTISYNYSATLLFKEKQFNKNKKQNYIHNLLAFAPINFPILTNIKNEQSQLDTLKFSKNEVLFIDSLFDGKAYIGATSNKKQFLSEAEKAKIIHISSHAIVNDSLPMQSEIAFADSMLHIHEIYNLPLSAELSVLSACQTASGKIVRGEGIMSLARGFMYAGCPSVVSSLWSVNDKATTDLMKAFYANLKAGQAKDKALQNAQQIVMQQKANPYYWAAFVQIGDTKAVYSSNKLFYIAIFGFLTLLMSIFAFAKKRKNI